MPAPAAPPAAPPPSPTAQPSLGAAPPPGAGPKMTPMDESFAAMNKFAETDDEQPEAKPAAPPKPPAKPGAKPTGKTPAEKPPKQEGKPPGEEEGEEQQRQEQEQPGEREGDAGKPPKGQKVKPWDLIDRFKGRAIQLEKENAELRAKQNGHELPKEALEKITTLETRNKELEGEIQFAKYEKSTDYLENYHKPYVEAWQKALGELKELTITDANGQTRYGNADDLLMLAQLPLGKARQLANQWFGDTADDMMAHRRVIRELSDKQHKALEEARSKGGEREQQQSIEQQAKDKVSQDNMAKAWHTINTEALAKHEFLRPVEGQTERNERLEKAVQFVDESFNLNVNNAKTEQERENILRRHSALRNRAIGFSVLKHENKSLKTELADLKKQLEEFQKSEPTAGEAGHERGSSMATNPMEAAMHDLANLAE